MNNMTSISVFIIRYVVKDMVLDVLFFPIWWYSTGLIRAYRKTIDMFKYGNSVLAIKIWVINWFKPMFAQFDWQGRLISVFIRTVQIIFRLILLILWTIFVCILFILWIILPMVIVYNILSHLIW